MAAVGLNGISNHVKKLNLALIQNLYASDFTREIMLETQRKVSGKNFAGKCVLSQLMKEARLDTFDMGALRTFVLNCIKVEEEEMKQQTQTRECQVIQRCLQNPTETNQRTIQRQIYVDFRTKS